MYLSGHPMATYAEVYRNELVARSDEIAQSAAGESDKYSDEQYVDVLAIVTAVKKKATKSGANMAFVTLEDIYGSLEMLVFPKILERSGDLLQPGTAVKVHGRISFTEEKDPKLICDYAQAPMSPEVMLSGAKSPQSAESGGRRVQKGAVKGLCLRVPAENSPTYRKAMQYVEVFDGECELYLVFADTGRRVRAGANHRVDVNSALVRALEKLLGRENVALLEK